MSPSACLLMTDHDGNTDLGMVAVVPEARGRGITGKLLGRALADAAERGNRTSTLIATKMGYPVYERAGYRPNRPHLDVGAPRRLLIRPARRSPRT